MSLIDKVQRMIDGHGLMTRDGLYLVALSGGADSVALLCCLHELGYRVEAVHCNFHLRGAESDRDEDFCRNLCSEMGVKIHVAHYDTRTYAELHQVSIEMAARDLRYRYFEQLREDLAADDICVAHHRDDSVETVLMNLIRGTGLRGLTGIAPRNGHVVRPLLDISRQEIESFLHLRGQDFVTDSTNLVDDVVRNKIRLNILPLMEGINPSVRESIHRMSLRLAEADEILTQTLGEKADAARLPLAGSPSPADRQVFDIQRIDSEYLLFHILTPYGFNPSQIEEVACRMKKAETGREWLSATHQLLIDRGRLLVERRETAVFQPLHIPEEGCYVLPDGSKVKVERRIINDGFVISRAKDCVTLDAAKVAFPLTLRRTEPGDWFVPSGMKGGRKLVSDFLTDAKRSLFDKRRQLVMADGGGKVVWVVGERVDNRVLIGKDTCEALVIALL